MMMFSEHESATAVRQVEEQAQVGEAAIVARDLLRVFGQKTAVNRVNLTIKRGEFFGFLGPNGAGKPTTIKMFTGLLRPTAGETWVGGVNVWQDQLKARALM